MELMGRTDDRLGWLTATACGARQPPLNFSTLSGCFSALGCLPQCCACCSTLGSTSSRTACEVQLLLGEAAAAMEDSMTATFDGDADAVVEGGHKLQRLASEIRALLPFLRGASTDVVNDIDGAATNAKQTGDTLSAVTKHDPADISLLNLARDSASARSRTGGC